MVIVGILKHEEKQKEDHLSYLWFQQAEKVNISA